MLSHAPKDLVRRKADKIMSKGNILRAESRRIRYLVLDSSAFGETRSNSMGSAKKKIIIKYPPKILGEGNVPITRLSINISLA